jgi:hypothetical protein
MKIDKTHKLFGKVILVDAIGHVIDRVISYDTETGMAEIYISANKGKHIVVGGSSNYVVTATVHIPGAKLKYKKSDKLVKEV